MCLLAPHIYLLLIGHPNHIAWLSSQPTGPPTHRPSRPCSSAKPVIIPVLYPSEPCNSAVSAALLPQITSKSTIPVDSFLTPVPSSLPMTTGDTPGTPGGITPGMYHGESGGSPLAALSCRSPATSLLSLWLLRTGGMSTSSRGDLCNFLQPSSLPTYGTFASSDSQFSMLLQQMATM